MRQALARRLWKLRDESAFFLYDEKFDRNLIFSAAPQTARHLVQLGTGELTQAQNSFWLDRPMQHTKKLAL